MHLLNNMKIQNKLIVCNSRDDWTLVQFKCVTSVGRKMEITNWKVTEKILFIITLYLMLQTINTLRKDARINKEII